LQQHGKEKASQVTLASRQVGLNQFAASLAHDRSDDKWPEPERLQGRNIYHVEGNEKPAELLPGRLDIVMELER
jgi:hypothetical protein